MIEINPLKSYEFSERLEMNCKNWIENQFINNKVVNNLLKNFDDEQLDELYDFCFSYIDKVNQEQNIYQAKIIEKLTNYLFLSIDSNYDEENSPKCQSYEKTDISLDLPLNVYSGLKNVYSDFSTIQEQYTLEIKNFSPLTNLKNLKQVQNLLLQNQLNSKKLMTEVLTKNNNSSCLIWKSLLADLENHSALYLNLKKSVDQFVVDAEEENITRERIEASRKPTMSEEDLRKKAVVEAARANEKAAAESLIKNNDKAANSKVEQEKIAENELELDGESEDPTGDVSVSYQSSTKKYLVAISSNLGEEDLVLRATKKGAKSLQYKVTTNAEGNVKFSTKNVLKGFTMTLLFNGERLDSVKVK